MGRKMDFSKIDPEILKKAQALHQEESMKIERYNESILGMDNDIEKELESKLKSVGWEINMIDLNAMEDFKWNRKCSNQDILKFALRYYLPKDIYHRAKQIMIEKYFDQVLNFERGLKESLEYSDDSVETNISTYNNTFSGDMCTIQEEFKDLKMRFSWRIPELDYLAASEFRKIYKCSFKEILTSSLRFYLEQKNYDKAEKILNIRVNTDLDKGANDNER